MLAAANNVDWYDAAFRSLGLPPPSRMECGRRGDPAPPYHPTRVILSPVAGDAIGGSFGSWPRSRTSVLVQGRLRYPRFRTGRFPAALRCRMDLARRSSTVATARDLHRRVARVVTAMSSPPGKWGLRANGSPAHQRFSAAAARQNPAMAFMAAWRGGTSSPAALPTGRPMSLEFSNYFSG